MKYHVSVYNKTRYCFLFYNNLNEKKHLTSKSDNFPQQFNQNITLSTTKIFFDKELSFFLQTIQIFFSIPCNRWLLAWWEVEVVHCPSPGPPASSGRWTYVAPSSPPLWGCYSSAPHCHGEVTAAGVDVLCISLLRCSGRAPCLRAGRRNTGGPICWVKKYHFDNYVVLFYGIYTIFALCYQLNAKWLWICIQNTLNLLWTMGELMVKKDQIMSVSCCLYYFKTPNKNR